MNASTWTRAALALDDVEEHIACEGTAIEQKSYKIKRSTFLFVQEKDGGLIIRIKLKASIDDAKAKVGDDHVETGSTGWTTLRVHKLIPADVIKAWVGESYAISTTPTKSVRRRKKK